MNWHYTVNEFSRFSIDIIALLETFLSKDCQSTETGAQYSFYGKVS